MTSKRTTNGRQAVNDRLVFTDLISLPTPLSYLSVIIWTMICCFPHHIRPNSPVAAEPGRTLSSTDTSETVRVAFVLTEETPVGTRIGNVLLGLQSANVPPNSITSPVENLLELKSNKYLGLNGSSGDLFVQSRIDRESLCRDAGTCCASNVLSMDESNLIRPQFRSVQNSKLPEPVFLNCFLRILVLQSPNSEQLIEIIVYVVDVNDNPPKWSQQILDLEIPEHVSVGSLYKLPEATDADQGPANTVVGYRLYPAVFSPQTSQVRCLQCPEQNAHTLYMSSISSTHSGPSLFSLESQVVENNALYGPKFSLNLRVDNELDREKQAIHYLILTATDGMTDFDSHPIWSVPVVGSEALEASHRTHHTGSLTIRVTVLDINDQPPVFIDAKPTVSVAENVKVGTVIYQAVARDADVIDKNSLIYRISSSASPEVVRCFAVNQSTGEVFTKSRLYFPNASILSDSRQNTPANYARQPLVFGYVIPIQVTDRLHQAEATITVQLTQVNTQPPKITVSSHLRMSGSGDQLWIAEDTPIDSIVAMINVMDPDKPFTYGTDEDELFSSGNPRGNNRPQCFTNHENFVIRPLTANSATEFKLVLRKPLDREVLDSHSLRIECWDAGTPPLSSEVRFFVRVEDIDDSPPQFENSVSRVTIKEGLPPHTLITRVQATDADVGENARIAYRILSQLYAQAVPDSAQIDTATLVPPNKPLVTIDKTTGELFNEIIFDREAMSTINCTVEAYGPRRETEAMESSPNLASSKSRVNFKAHIFVIISIEDVNDCTPQFNVTSYEFTVVEGQQAHHQVSGQSSFNCEPTSNIFFTD
ncbi:Protocadherin gamma-A10 [Fasciolopsis buskii]|uniref:Protocadherin gamma-A10 n=1 Tax=Fasciolopsis buskii TaxID=27845 RepID=A0A8E0VIH8_9TREM|nr:Protocadherin gamma-A10 [Fasciolopsis buski]